MPTYEHECHFLILNVIVPNSTGWEKAMTPSRCPPPVPQVPTIQPSLCHRLASPKPGHDWSKDWFGIDRPIYQETDWLDEWMDWWDWFSLICWIGCLIISKTISPCLVKTCFLRPRKVPGLWAILIFISFVATNLRRPKTCLLSPRFVKKFFLVHLINWLIIV